MRSGRGRVEHEKNTRKIVHKLKVIFRNKDTSSALRGEGNYHSGVKGFTKTVKHFRDYREDHPKRATLHSTLFVEPFKE